MIVLVPDTSEPVFVQDLEVRLVPHEQLQQLKTYPSVQGMRAFGNFVSPLSVNQLPPGLCLSQVYFTWVIRDFGSAEWFHSLLQAIEEQDTQNRIEINIYLTAKIKEDDMNNIIVCGFMNLRSWAAQPYLTRGALLP